MPMTDKQTPIQRIWLALLKMRVYATIMTMNGTNTPSPMTATAYEYEVLHWIVQIALLRMYS